MRRPQYLSPTALMQWRNDKDKYYMKYLCETKLPREPQTQPMSVGSSFDAFVKSYLYKELIGKNDPRFEFDNLFTSQVEPHNRDLAKIHGEYTFVLYKKSGALADLMREMEKCIGEPRFELSVESELEFEGKKVKFLGKPDVYFVNRERAQISLDFKVNGFYGKSNTSPMKGYLRLYPGLHQHDDTIGNTVDFKGIRVSKAYKLEQLNADWAAQVGIYAWLCGCEIGADWVAGIEQIVGKNMGQRLPELRFAQHRMFVDPDWQRELFREAAECWETVQSDWIFRDMTQEQSVQRCLVLDQRVNDLANIKPEDFDFYKLCAKNKPWH
jgi:hypothetical protein